MALRAGIRAVRRWKHGMDVSDDASYAATLETLSEGSVRRHFNPYADIDWDAPEFRVTPNDPRWVLSVVDPLGRHPWYQAQPLEKQIAVGMWRQANIAKVSLHLENILIRGLMQYAFWVPNGSPEYRYCLHESVEECNHTLMFQEMVNRIGVDVPGMPRWLRWLSPMIPLYAGPLPGTFFFGVLAGEVPVDYLQKNMLREDRSVHPILENVMAIHVAEEARHIAFGHEYLRRHVPGMARRSRFFLSLYVPIIMRVFAQAIFVPTRRFFTEFDIPRSVRKELFFGASDARQTLRDMFGDIRMLCHEVGLMNPVARLMWRICRIGGRSSRYRGEPQRACLPTNGDGVAPPHLGDPPRPAAMPYFQDGPQPRTI
ncbi:MAG: AurF N-oxygenase family protein [Mycobacterium sp.]